MPSTTHPGDDIVADANLVLDRERSIAATPEAIWPWLLQLGKRRAGWYAPRRVELVLPRKRRAIRHLDPAWQHLSEGQRIPDYGGRRADLEVAYLEAPNVIVYRDQRGSTPFSWALTLTPSGADRTVVHLRFRGRLKSTGLQRRLIHAGAEFFDGLTGEIMLRGLQERVEPAERGLTTGP